MAYPNATFEENKENGVTGNFDVDIDGVRVHSKKGNGDGFPNKDWKTFITKVKAEVEK